MSAMSQPSPPRAAAGDYWVVAGGGAVTPLGSSLEQTAASLTARLQRFRRTGMPDISALPITTSEVQGVTTGLAGAARLQAMLQSAMEEALSALPPPGTLEGAALLVLALPDRIGPEGCRYMAEWAGQCADAVPAWAALGRNACRTVQAGAAGGFAALEVAHAEMLRNPDLRIALLASVDSFCEPTLLRQFVEADLVHRKGNEEGFVASEAASAVLLARRPDVPARRYALLRPALAQSPHALWPHDRQTDGSVLQPVLDGALRHAGLGTEHISHWLSDADGSAWRSREEQGALMRLTQTSETAHLGGQIPELATRLGQIGAAWGPLYWGLTEVLSRYRLRRTNAALTWALDPSGHAGAAVMVRSALPD
ncbi:hypothetical protein ACFX58_19420 [Sphingomonas sp. NCPPB 2930]